MQAVLAAFHYCRIKSKLLPETHWALHDLTPDVFITRLQSHTPLNTGQPLPASEPLHSLWHALFWALSVTLHFILHSQHPAIHKSYH